ncbi:MAG: abortive infection family protein [Ignavibacteriales bacterium]|nr:abortive infection family protein [Ignavibacteriales bacterium]
MKLSDFTIKNLAKSISGDTQTFPYLSGPRIIEFLSKYGLEDEYGSGFGTRWKYLEEKLMRLNGSQLIENVIEDALDPRRFHNTDKDYNTAAKEINEFLQFDNIELVKNGKFYKLTDLKGNIVEGSAVIALNDEFIQEQIQKCQEKIQREDYNGAITNARSLLESIFLAIIERDRNAEVKNDGDLIKQWKDVRKIMKMEADKESMPEFLIQIISGLTTSINGFAALSNNAGDRHANKFKTSKHHAKLAVNFAIALSDFLLESWDYQKRI